MNINKFLITMVLSLVFVFIIILKIKAGLALSFAFFFILIFWTVSKQLNEKKFILIFFIIYPLLPSLAGISIGGGIPVFRYHRFAVILLIIFLLSKGLLLKYYREFIKSNIFTFNFAILFLSMFTTAFFSRGSQSTFFFTISIIFELFILTVVVFSVFKTDEEIGQLINSLLISCTILCIFGLFEKISGFNFYSLFGSFIGNMTPQMRGGSIRVQASFSHSIAYGAFLVAILPLYFYKYNKNFTKFNLYFILVMSSVIASQSRAGIIGAIIVILLYLIFVERNNMILFIIICIPIVIYNASDIFKYLIDLNPLTTTSTEMADSTNARGIQFQFMIALIKKNLAFGFGLVSANIGSIDNFYLLFIYQFGLVGLISYLLLIFSALTKPFRIIGVELFKDLRMLSMLFSIVAIFVINTVVALWSFQFIYFIYIGIIARLISNKKTSLIDQPDSTI